MGTIRFSYVCLGLTMTNTKYAIECEQSRVKKRGWTICRKFVILLILKTIWIQKRLYEWPLYDLFWPLFCNLLVYLSKNWGSDSHFEGLYSSYLWLVQKLWHKTKIFSFLFFLLFCTKTDICVFCVFCIFVITFVLIKIQTCKAPQNDHLNLN